MKSAEEKLIEALESYVAFREADEAWLTEFKRGTEELRQNIVGSMATSMEKVAMLTGYSAEKGRQAKILNEGVESTIVAATRRSERLNEAHSARTAAILRLKEVLNK